jgi:uncharacterized Fe-S cluster-containing radical SAM superfamily enzyme
MYIFSFRFFSPLGMVPVVALVGFGLFDRGFPVVRLLPLCTSLTFAFYVCTLIVGDPGIDSLVDMLL